MTYVKTVLLDVDGVLADFAEGFREYFGMDAPDTPHWAFYRSWGWSDRTFLEHLYSLPSSFWAGLRPFEHAHELVQRLSRRFDLVLCTAVPTIEAALAGRLAWVRQHFRGLEDSLIFCPIERKPLLARGDVLLIDDNEDTCRRFAQRGGWSFLWPAFWNRKQDVGPREALEALRRKYAV